MPKNPSSEITSRRVYLNRRAFMQSLIVAGGATLVTDVVSRAAAGRAWTEADDGPESLQHDGKAETWEHLTTYNNFYEFGTDKSDPAVYAPRWRLPAAMDRCD